MIVRLRLAAVALSTKGTPSIQIGVVDRDAMVIASTLAVATTREDVRRLVRALQALAVDLPEGG